MYDATPRIDNLEYLADFFYFIYLFIYHGRKPVFIMQ